MYNFINDNYTIYHLHTMLSNGVTNIDSVTSIEAYVERAKECGMKAIAFSEHGNIFEWKHKKDIVEKAGMKYIHAIEGYITENINLVDENGKELRVRDNYHCVLIAKNYDGVREINRLSSRSFNREDGHFYYSPRITFDELLGTSDNVIICTACIASILSKGNEELKDRFISFLKENSERCFLEIQHHNTESQKEYNKYLYELNKKIGVRLIAGTDTHCLNESHAEARVIYQKGKGVFFSEEDGWDLTFKTLEELINAYKEQDCLDEEVFMEAIDNTNVMANMVEPFTLDTSFKYPKLTEDSKKTFREKVYEKAKKHKYINERYDWETIKPRLDEELDTYESVDSYDLMLLQDYLRDWEHKHDIWTGPSRGSVSGSFVAYALGITEIDSIKFDLKFWRFMHKDKYSLAD